MRTHALMILGLSVLGACAQWTPVDDGGTTCTECKCPAPPDLLLPTPKCDAAKGLPGENLICFDFSSIGDQTLTTPPPPQLSGWDFEKFDKSCWQILNGKLQVKNFSTFMGNCGFLMLGVKPSDYQKYNSFTLSVVQTLVIDKQQQAALVYLGTDLDPRLVDATTGTQPRQQRIYAINKTALPNGTSYAYQPLFKLASGITIGLAGWQIESIAINASP